jgi:replicative DNA helicase
VRTDYIARVRQLLNTIRHLQPLLSSSAEVEQELAVLERELQDAAKELTIQACRNEVLNRRSAAVDRRQSHVPVTRDLRVKPRRRSDSIESDSTLTQHAER